MSHVKHSIPRLSLLPLQIESHTICGWLDENDPIITVYDEGADSKLL